MHKAIVNDDRFIWDFWYFYDKENKLFHLFYLNADPSTVSEEKFHEAAKVGYAVTKDFTNIEWGPSDVLIADKNKWFNTSIWSGDTIKIKNGYLIFFTSRDRNEDDGFTQNIGMAYSDRIDTDKWEPITDIRIKPDTSVYTPRSIKGDYTIHTWRDPFLFINNEQIYMLVSAKIKNQPIGKNGVIALLKNSKNDFRTWEALPPISNPGLYSEMEVAQLFMKSKENYELVFSSSIKHNEEVRKNKVGGLYSITSSNMKDFDNSTPRELLPLKSGIYAGRIIPELDGEIVGFDTETGGIRRSGVKTSYKNVNRDFTNYIINL